jgi:hypothetical protein
MNKTVETKETKKTVAKKPATTKKEKVMKEKKTETKKVAPKENKTKENKKVTVTMTEVMEMLNEAGIKVYNPQAKGNYRIFGSKKGSSLNLQKAKYIIFSTDTDYEAVEGVKDKYSDLVLGKGANSQDKSRPNSVEFTELNTLKAVLKLYAKNPLNVAAK